MAAIEKDDKGRYVVRDGDRVFGVYRNEAMALRRVQQLVNSRHPSPGVRRQRVKVAK